MSNHLTWLPSGFVMKVDKDCVGKASRWSHRERRWHWERKSWFYERSESSGAAWSRKKYDDQCLEKKCEFAFPWRAQKSPRTAYTRGEKIKKENPMKRRITKHSIGLTQNNKKIKKEEADAFNHSLQKAKSAEKNTKFEFWQQGLYFDNLNTNYIQNTDYKYWMISNKTPMFLVGLPQPA